MRRSRLSRKSPLRLIPNHVRTLSYQPTSVSQLYKLFAVAGLAFLILKFPLIFSPFSNEEMRDLHALIHASRGEKPIRDFTWLYGPVVPLIYGELLRVFPKILLTIRCFSLVVWLIGVLYLVRLFSRYLRGFKSPIIGTLFASGLFATFPTYIHNHDITAVAILASIYHILVFFDEGKWGSFYLSASAMLLALFTRPVTVGFSYTIAWTLLFLSIAKIPLKVRLLQLLYLTISALVIVFLLYLYCGPSWKYAFLPSQSQFTFWTRPEGYPNLAFLDPGVGSGGISATRIRGALETFAFYFYAFGWPICLSTILLQKLGRISATERAIGLMSLLGYSAWAFDLFFFGPTPRPDLSSSSMGIRAQFCAAPVTASIFLFLWSNRRTRWQKIAGLICLVPLFLWGYLRFFTGLYRIIPPTAFHADFPALKHIAVNPTNDEILQAFRFINSHCNPTDSVVITFFYPGASALLKCKDTFANDPAAFIRNSDYQFKKGENPYYPEGGLTNNDYIEKRVREYPPRFFLVITEQPYARLCTDAWPLRKDFDLSPMGKVRVCWR